uniref:Uncharacterized protein n=1 Tax=Chromera velia CCMP2878 TaxID=1169474 RepID=A0A0G4GRI5_9ALVE|eukprot:Cvel_23075.t1-p1 / transcript=Cvel_23075.t1 / gene=Cvel_23075 / organism=Chromera_velia_CCMP2878 / gene_product=hypothetical protein / transcript_product=hypothetical protein / location=Cvel_scaffold2337:5575-10129(-) / protein_length=1369 / sequence_SO=supercontig / SO=protein_coding / is_pseudo=false
MRSTVPPAADSRLPTEQPPPFHATAAQGPQTETGPNVQPPSSQSPGPGLPSDGGGLPERVGQTRRGHSFQPRAHRHIQPGSSIFKIWLRSQGLPPPPRTSKPPRKDGGKAHAEADAASHCQGQEGVMQQEEGGDYRLDTKEESPLTQPGAHLCTDRPPHSATHTHRGKGGQVVPITGGSSSSTARPALLPPPPPPVPPPSAIKHDDPFVPSSLYPSFPSRTQISSGTPPPPPPLGASQEAPPPSILLLPDSSPPTRRPVVPKIPKPPRSRGTPSPSPERPPRPPQMDLYGATPPPPSPSIPPSFVRDQTGRTTAASYPPLRSLDTLQTAQPPLLTAPPPDSSVTSRVGLSSSSSSSSGRDFPPAAAAASPSLSHPLLSPFGSSPLPIPIPIPAPSLTMPDYPSAAHRSAMPFSGETLRSPFEEGGGASAVTVPPNWADVKHVYRGSAASPCQQPAQRSPREWAGGGALFGIGQHQTGLQQHSAAAAAAASPYGGGGRDDDEESWSPFRVPGGDSRERSGVPFRAQQQQQQGETAGENFDIQILPFGVHPHPCSGASSTEAIPVGGARVFSGRGIGAVQRGGGEGAVSSPGGSAAASAGPTPKVAFEPPGGRGVMGGVAAAAAGGVAEKGGKHIRGSASFLSSSAGGFPFPPTPLSRPFVHSSSSSSSSSSKNDVGGGAKKRDNEKGGTDVQMQSSSQAQRRHSEDVTRFAGAPHEEPSPLLAVSPNSGSHFEWTAAEGEGERGSLGEYTCRDSEKALLPSPPHAKSSEEEGPERIPKPMRIPHVRPQGPPGPPPAVSSSSASSQAAPLSACKVGGVGPQAAAVFPFPGSFLDPPSLSSVTPVPVPVRTPLSLCSSPEEKDEDRLATDEEEEEGGELYESSAVARLQREGEGAREQRSPTQSPENRKRDEPILGRETEGEGEMQTTAVEEAKEEEEEEAEEEDEALFFALRLPQGVTRSLPSALDPTEAAAQFQFLQQGTQLVAQRGGPTQLTLSAPFTGGQPCEVPKLQQKILIGSESASASASGSSHRPPFSLASIASAVLSARQLQEMSRKGLADSLSLSLSHSPPHTLSSHSQLLTSAPAPPAPSPETEGRQGGDSRWRDWRRSGTSPAELELEDSEVTWPWTCEKCAEEKRQRLERQQRTAIGQDTVRPQRPRPTALETAAGGGGFHGNVLPAHGVLSAPGSAPPQPLAKDMQWSRAAAAYTPPHPPPQCVASRRHSGIASSLGLPSGALASSESEGGGGAAAAAASPQGPQSEAGAVSASGDRLGPQGAVSGLHGEGVSRKLPCWLCAMRKVWMVASLRRREREVGGGSEAAGPSDAAPVAAPSAAAGTQGVGPSGSVSWGGNGGTAEEVERLLRAAEPESYED